MEEKLQQETAQIETTPGEEVPFTPEVPEETEKRWVKPLILSALGVLIAVSLVFGGYKLAQIRQVQLQPTPTPVVVPTPTPEPTTDWKIYTNIKYGYSIKYPEDMFYLEREAKLPRLQSVEFTKKDASTMGEIPGVEVTVYEDEGLSLKTWFDKRSTTEPFEVSESPTIFYYKVTGKQEISFNGSKGIRFVDNQITGAPIPTAIVSAQNLVVSIRGYYFIHDESLQEIYNLMLSTFRFLRGTEGWKTYMNSEYKFSFKYPADFTIEENLVPTANYLQVIVNKNKQDSFSIKASKDYQPADVTYFLDTPAIGQQAIGNNTWAAYSLPEGYGLPEGTSPIYGLQLEKNGILYTLTFFNQTEITSTQNRILSTLKFID